MFEDYYGSFTYADDLALAALEGTTLTYTAPASVTFNFGAASDSARREAIRKGTAYMHVWMYAIREFEDAIDDCVSCSANCNTFSANDGGPVHAWDEGVAFYTGSLEGTAQGGTSAGVMVYRLAEKRCANFGTCTCTLTLILTLTLTNPNHNPDQVRELRHLHRSGRHVASQR